MGKKRRNTLRGIYYDRAYTDKEIEFEIKQSVDRQVWGPQRQKIEELLTDKMIDGVGDSVVMSYLMLQCLSDCVYSVREGI